MKTTRFASSQTLSITLVLSAFLALAPSLFSANIAFAAGNIGNASSSAPVVSIGSGNGNTPSNTGPVSGTAYSDTAEIPVYATITDSDHDLESYHFRIVKDGGVDGYTCSSLLAPWEQGYASTTLGRDGCGYVFNQAVYMDPWGFTDKNIATLNAADIVAFSGEGNYWLILGAVDQAGNRTNANYLLDPRVEITIGSTTATSTAPGGGTGTSTPPTTGTSTPPTTGTSTSPTTNGPEIGGGGGGGGGSGVFTGGGGYYYPLASSQTSFSGSGSSDYTFPESGSGNTTGNVGNGNYGGQSYSSTGGYTGVTGSTEIATSSSATTTATSTNTSNYKSLAASAGFAGASWKTWLGLILILALVGAGIFFLTR